MDKTIFTRQFKFSELDFDIIFTYEGKDKLILFIDGEWFLPNQRKFKNTYNQICPKYTFPMFCDLELERCEPPILPVKKEIELL